MIFPHNSRSDARLLGGLVHVVTSSTDIDLQTEISRSDRILYSEVDGDVTMMSVETGKYYSLRAVGARIWSLLERPTSAALICDQLMAEYRVDRERCEADVMRVMRHLASEGIVEEAARQP
jgi:hypothetical protein